MEQTLGFVSARVATDVPIVELGFEAGVIDGMHVLVQLAGAVELAKDTADAAGAMHIGNLPLAGRSGLADAGHGVRDALDVIEREVHVGALRASEDVQHGVGGAAHGHIHRHGVFERMLRGDGTRQHGIVILMIVAVRQIDDKLAGFLEQFLAVGVGGKRRSIARQREAEGLGEAVHGIGGEHTRAGTAGRACGALEVDELLVGDVVVGGGGHNGDEVRAFLLAVDDGVAGFHRAAGDEDRGDVEAQSRHEHARRDFVAVGDADKGVGAMRVDGVLDCVGDDIAAGQ